MRRLPSSSSQLLVECLEDRLVLSAAVQVDPRTWSSDHILVRFAPDLDDGSLNRIALADTHVGEALPLVAGLYEVRLDAGISVAEAVSRYQADPHVLSAEPDFQLHVNRTPNDPNFSSQWALRNTGQNGGVAEADLDAPKAWDVTTGAGRTVVAVIDSGIEYTHPDLAANVWTNAGEVAGNGRDDDHNGYVDDVHGYDFTNNDGDPMDDAGHGTQVAGIIGAAGNNGRGVAGVAWNVKLMALKFLDAEGVGYTSDAIRALDYAVANGASISNHSWGDDGYSASLDQAIARARTAGHIVVTAAGNSGTNNDQAPTYPASYSRDNVVVVAASDAADELAPFSNFGPHTVQLTAPGVGILSTTPGGGYGYASGTSMAAPFVTGVLALVREQHPEWTYRQVIDQVLKTVDPVPGLRGRVATGGRVNAAAALQPVAADRTGPRVLTAAWSGQRPGSLDRVRLTFSEPIQANTFSTLDVVRFTGPNGSLKILAIAAVPNAGGRQFDLVFGPQTAAGTYQMVLGPTLTDSFGNSLDQDGDSHAGEAAQDTFLTATNLGNALTLYSVGERPVNDFRTTVSTIMVTQDLPIADLNVRLQLSHTQDQDLRIVLRAPWGAEVELVDGRGGTGDNFASTTLDDEATTSIAAGRPAFTGSFRPEQALAVFEGHRARGVWELHVEDRARTGTGTLHSWTMQIGTAPK